MTHPPNPQELTVRRQVSTSSLHADVRQGARVKKKAGKSKLLFYGCHIGRSMKGILRVSSTRDDVPPQSARSSGQPDSLVERIRMFLLSFFFGSPALLILDDT